ncbi:unnamed protein product, partial [Darwinula stevensoni]
MRGFNCSITCGQSHPLTLSIDTIRSFIHSLYLPFSGNEIATTCVERFWIECGKSFESCRIVGGYPVCPGKYPWMAAISYRGDFQCGGSLINDKYILTAAHCLIGNASGYLVSLGDHDLKVLSEAASISVPVSGLLLHPEYTHKDDHYVNDIALLELKVPVNFKEHSNIRPVCLPKPDEMDVGKEATVAGWGSEYS